MSTTSRATKTTKAINDSGLFSCYEHMPGMPAKLMPKLRKLCGERYIDLLLHMPTAITSRTYIKSLGEAIDGQKIVVKVKIIKHNSGGHGRAPYRIFTTDSNGETLELIFFNKGRWLASSYPVDKEIYVIGTFDSTLTGKQIVHPEQKAVSNKLDDISGLIPTYPLTSGITNNMLCKAINFVLEELGKTTTAEWLPAELLAEHKWPSFYEALKQIHKPKAIHEVAVNTSVDLNHPARARLAFDELYAWQVALMQGRQQNNQLTGFNHKLASPLLEQFLTNFGYKLTGDQQKTVAEIEADMQQPSPMLRLVQGDVGSGKTIVALISCLRAITNNTQAVIMAPTEILAIQHYNNAKALLNPLGIEVGLLTGKLKAKPKREVKALIANHEVDLIIGTHALIQEDVHYHKVGLVVIDEQHRFGVKQRLALTEQEEAPDLLVMTATPIPRTLALTCYGDMDISIIAEKPPGRTPIDTKAIPIQKVPEIAVSLQRILDKNQQVYWVCPLVEESMVSDLAAATKRYATLQQIYGNQAALLHGKMKGTEKEAIINDFRAGKTKILVSTTVIEVGIDVAQATVMVIEHAERFGLAQLHQLRGRIGRGSLKSNCLLLYSAPLTSFAKQRLDILRKSNDGFLLAEKDLQLRGPGEALGTQQSGHMVTKVANLAEHRDLIPIARNLARANIENSTNSTTTNINIISWLLTAFNKHQAAKLLSAG